MLNLLLSVTDGGRCVLPQLAVATVLPGGGTALLRHVTKRLFGGGWCGECRPHVHVPGVGGHEISSARALIMLLFDMEAVDEAVWTSPQWDWRHWLDTHWGAFGRDYTGTTLTGRISAVRFGLARHLQHLCEPALTFVCGRACSRVWYCHKLTRRRGQNGARPTAARQPVRTARARGDR